MDKQQNDTWLSVQLYYNEPWEDFLQKAVEPYVNTAIQTGIAHQYFFIRYWEKGPHIRLRLKGNAEMVNTILKPNLEEHFTHYFESKPSRRIEPNYPPNFSSDLKWHPNNSIGYNEYQPELNRFGGKIGTQLSERQFMLSSKVILEFIKIKGKSWSYDDAMGAAIKLHLSFIHAAGFDLDSSIQFFDFFTKNWLPYTFKNIEEQLNKEDFNIQSGLSIDAFEKAFSNQREVLIPFHVSLWEALGSNDEFEESILNYWVTENLEIISELTGNFKEGNLTLRAQPHSYPVKPANHNNELVWSILADYIHLTNNRLGILNRDESYLSFIMMRCLEEIKKNEKTFVS